MVSLKSNFFKVLIFISGFYVIQVYSQQSTVSALPANPFGIGVPYTFFKINNLSERAVFRKSQLENAKILTGKGGYSSCECIKFFSKRFKSILICLIIFIRRYPSEFYRFFNHCCCWILFL